MAEINVASNETIDSAEKPSAVDTVEIAQTVIADETTTTPLESAIPSAVESSRKENESAKKPIDESLSIVIIDDDDDDVEREVPSISPPRKSARLSAKRRDSTTENESDSRKLSESPLPKRRSMRLNSASSQDTPPPKIRDESSIKKMPTISENVKDVQGECDRSEKDGNKNKCEQALVDELAAAFVDEFID